VAEHEIRPVDRVRQCGGDGGDIQLRGLSEPAPVARQLHRGDQRRRDLRVSSQVYLHLAGLHPESADLHLAVHPAVELELAVG
jgi:hypothetical protein